MNRDGTSLGSSSKAQAQSWIHSKSQNSPKMAVRLKEQTRLEVLNLTVLLEKNIRAHEFDQNQVQFGLVGQS